MIWSWRRGWEQAQVPAGEHGGVQNFPRAQQSWLCQGLWQQWASERQEEPGKWQEGAEKGGGSWERQEGDGQGRREMDKARGAGRGSSRGGSVVVSLW